MTITITKLRLALGVIVVALMVPATAVATHVFDDVPDDKFYAGPVEWAADTGITTGTSPTTFDPDRGVTRGESVTFLKRYHDYVVANQAAMFDSDTRGSTFVSIAVSPMDFGVSATVTIPDGHTGVLELEFSSETTCGNGGVGGFCTVTILNNGTAVGMADQIIDSSDNGVESGNAWESHSVRRVTGELPSGVYVITAQGSEGTGAPVFSTRNAMITAQVHLTG
jgi:hypothetical protein